MTVGIDEFDVRKLCELLGGELKKKPIYSEDGYDPAKIVGTTYICTLGKADLKYASELGELSDIIMHELGGHIGFEVNVYEDGTVSFAAASKDGAVTSYSLYIDKSKPAECKISTYDNYGELTCQIPMVNGAVRGVYIDGNRELVRVVMSEEMARNNSTRAIVTGALRLK
ncbi:MAG: hypothetical protein GXO43_01260 [Crenarchaeota archaeon]|nr:hypothetical protein [Thermoproteota archaeon]